MSTRPQIRRATPADQPACYRICLETSDNGGDGSHLHDDPHALGHVYVGPYLKFEPDFAVVIEDDQGVCGYCLSTPDSERFYEHFTRDWLPRIQKETPRPAGNSSGWTMTQHVHHLLWNPGPFTFFPRSFAPWPAHAHIDLLPRAQGRGLGRSIMERQMAGLKDSGAAGIHLCVSPENERAIRFYRRLGFTDLPERDSWPDGTLYLGRSIQ